MEKIQVTIMPENIQVEVEKGSTIWEAAQAADISIKSSCGGQGTCGRCAVKVLDGKVSGGDGNISKSKKAEGYILGCTAVIEGPITVEIPESSRLHEHQVLLDDSADGIIKESTLGDLGLDDAPMVKKVQLTLSEPTLTENASDFSRLSTELSANLNVDDITISYAALKTLPLKVREDNWKVTVTCLMHSNSVEIIRVEAGHVDTPPSKAGPAEQAQHINHSLFPRTISPLVPMSINNQISSCFSMPVSRAPETISPPT